MVNKKFVTPAEGDLFRVLRSVVSARGHVLAQVSLKQLLWFPPDQDRSAVQAWRNRTDRKALDFVVCDPATLRPLVAIELDEPSHTEGRRERRDEEVERVLDAAGLPLLRVITSRSYDTRELGAALATYLRAAAAS